MANAHPSPEVGSREPEESPLTSDPLYQWLKDRYVMSVKPVGVRDRGAVSGPIFLCVIGPMLLRYLQWETRDLGIPMKAMIEALDEIRIGVVKTPDDRPHLTVEQMSRLPAQPFSRLRLGDLAPK